MIMAPIGLDEEPNLDLRKESVPLPKVRACLELQTPHHPPVHMLTQICEDLGKGWTLLSFPGRNATIGRREGFEGTGRAEGSEEGEGDGEGSGRKAGCLVKDMAGYGVPPGGKRGFFPRKGYGFAHVVVFLSMM